MQDQFIALIASGIVALLGFFLRSAFSNIASRLDKLESALGQLLAELRAGNVTASTNTAEINILRQRMHELSSQVQQMWVVVDKCKNCNGREE